jgi:hypothetical protein
MMCLLASYKKIYVSRTKLDLPNRISYSRPQRVEIYQSMLDMHLEAQRSSPKFRCHQ